MSKITIYIMIEDGHKQAPKELVRPFSARTYYNSSNMLANRLYIAYIEEWINCHWHFHLPRERERLCQQQTDFKRQLLLMTVMTLECKNYNLLSSPIDKSDNKLPTSLHLLAAECLTTNNNSNNHCQSTTGPLENDWSKQLMINEFIIRPYLYRFRWCLFFAFASS